jgi:hypothetical protein
MATFSCRFYYSSGLIVAMLENYIPYSKTVLVVSDIFGMSEAFLALLDDIDSVGQAMAVSPYKQPQPQFEDEPQAYQYFLNNGGIEGYILSLRQVLQLNTDINHIIGFSAGAAAIYKLMYDLENNDFRLTLFYPSQIRHFLDKHPICSCRLIFPRSEPHFSLSEVIEIIQQQSQSKIEQSDYQHGFMNKDSKAFSKTAYRHYCQVLRTQIRES